MDGSGWSSYSVGVFLPVCLSTEKCRIHLLHTGKLKWLICGLNANVVPMCLCIHFPCGLSFKSWSIIPVMVSSRTRTELFHLVHNPATIENSSSYGSTHTIICHRRFVDVDVYTKERFAMGLHPLLLACTVCMSMFECV